MALPTLRSFDLVGQRVLLRFDGDIPVENGEIMDEFRLKSFLPTLRYCLDQKAQVVLLAHQGRPGGRVAPDLSNKILAEYFATKLNQSVSLYPQLPTTPIPEPIAMLENLRFWPGEEANDATFAQQLASLGDVYCNDAFAVSHRAHASIVGVPNYLPHCAGFKVLEEIVQLAPLLHGVETPYAVVLGGAKAADKAPILADLIPRVDSVLLGGIVAVVYLAAQGVKVGKHQISPEECAAARQSIKKMHEQHTHLELPVDFVNEDFKVKSIHHFESDDLMLDIGPKTVERYGALLHKANTIFWNGAMGKYEEPGFAKGTVGIAKAIAASPAGVRIGSGGDTSAAIHESRLAKGFTFISTGGGATLEYVAGRELPGIQALM